METSGCNISLHGLTEGAPYRVEAPGSGSAARLCTLTSTEENFGANVRMYDNVDASFVAVPEPGGAVLCLAAAFLAARRRKRPFPNQPES